jgi:hypothetical protein
MFFVTVAIKKKPAIFVAGFFRFLVVELNLHPLPFSEEEPEGNPAGGDPGSG